MYYDFVYYLEKYNLWNVTFVVYTYVHIMCKLVCVVDLCVYAYCCVGPVLVQEICNVYVRILWILLY